MKSLDMSLIAAFTLLLIVTCGVIRSSAQAASESKEQDKPIYTIHTGPAKIPIPRSAAKDALYAAVHKKDVADKAIAELNAKTIQFQSGAQQQFLKLDAQQKEAQKEQDAADAALLKELNLDDGRHMINHETMEAMIKPEPVKPPAPVQGR
jgi:hypothetical protein